MSNKRKLQMYGRGEETKLLRSLGITPKAEPRSGKCISCGNDLKATEDHSVCDACWPPSVDVKWKEPNPDNSPDYVKVDLDTGEFEEIPNPFEQLKDLDEQG